MRLRKKIKKFKMNKKQILINNFLLFTTILSILLLIYLKYDSPTMKRIYADKSYHNEQNVIVDRLTDHEIIIEEYYNARSTLRLSKLGDILFKNMSYPKMRKRHYKILIWKHGIFMETRHIKNFGKHRSDPFEGCSANNCILTYDKDDLKDADAVVILLHRTKNLKELPDSRLRPKHQIWIFLTDESPKHTFLYANNHWWKYSNIFNWSMNYKVSSDIPIPYGRTIPLNDQIDINIPISDIIPHYYQKRRDVLVAIMISNCYRSRRIDYLNELKKHITVDIYGRCGTTLKKTCKGHFDKDCSNINDYLFYLAFENSECEEYMTEKLFYNAYGKGAIPVILGANKEYCKTMLPPDSFLHVDNYARPADLARYISYINRTWHDNFFDYHQWRRHFRVMNEHGYFGSKSIHYCRICEALNYNKIKPHTYKKLDEFLSKKLNCKK